MKRFVRFYALILMFFLFMIPINSESYNDFSIRQHYPESQIDKNLGYYNLLLSPQQSEVINLELINEGDQDMIAELELNDGYTAINAVKAYDKQVKQDKSMVNPLTSFAYFSKDKVKVKAQSSEMVSLTLTMPDEFEGVKVAGITVSATKENSDHESKNDDGVSIKSRVAYLSVVQVQNELKAVKENLIYKGSHADLTSLEPGFVSSVQNDKATVMNDIMIQGKITDKKSGKIVASVDKTSGGILPNTTFNIEYTLKEDKLYDGTYLVDLKISSNKDSWHFKDEITVTKDDANTVNSKAPFKKNSSMLLFLIVFLLLIILILIYLLLKNKGNTNNEK